VSAPLVKQQAGNAVLRVGTCGYSYPEWVEAGIYPPGTKAGEMLPLYAREFSVTELNTTWYQMPQAESIERQLSLVPSSFLFCPKLTRSLTHEVDTKAWQGEVARFRGGIAPLVQAHQLLAILIQFGATFDRSSKHRSYLGALLTELDGLPLAVEFRNAAWANDKVFAENFAPGFTDGVRTDIDGNVWCSMGWADPKEDGVRCYAPSGDLIGKIHLPETCANLCFGGPKRNRLFMCGSTSVYATYVETQGALLP